MTVLRSGVRVGGPIAGGVGGAQGGADATSLRSEMNRALFRSRMELGTPAGRLQPIDGARSSRTSTWAVVSVLSSLSLVVVFSSAV